MLPDVATRPVPTVWAGHRTYASGALLVPASREQLASIVTSGTPVRTLGSRHSFTDLVDSPGVLVALDGLGEEPVLDADARTVTVPGSLTYGTLGPWLHERGFALAAMASLPHISVAGAVSTATHGSGDGATTLAGAVVALEIMGVDGEVRRVARGDAAFHGSVVALGALGPVLTVTLAVEPTYDVAQTVIDDVDLAAIVANLGAVHASASSVSVFTRWDGSASIWRKHRTDAAPMADLSGLGGRLADGPRHPIAGEDASSCTVQGGETGPWWARLPHFRIENRPSAGAELQSEHLVPQAVAGEAVAAAAQVLGRHRDLVLVSELRSMAADEHWLSSAHRRATVGIHTTWRQDVTAVTDVVAELEAALEPFEHRPHWGKVMATTDLARRYPRWDDAVALVHASDPAGVFAGPFTRRVGLTGA
ncbi:FAD-binding protein [Litorihabitans aurantiacus]|uniref:Xylitol oxidase n=1 Tax=Litorihabitans aurantiacus TaxID=1930061 RepID=A0AA37UQR1_9MICO|nr:FAD-binding protein [Litorihabitans aurantiacus]GMA31226.1 putative xylitol oxidase [Litorihabitans aurantiacus]